MSETPGSALYGKAENHSTTELIELVRTGSPGETYREQAADALLKGAIHLVTRWAIANTSNGVDRAEVISEALFRLARVLLVHSDGYSTTDEWHALANRVTKQAIIDRYRWCMYQQRHNTSLEGWVVPEESASSLPSVTSAEDAALARTAGQRMHQTLTNTGLSEQMAEICVRHHAYGQPYAEIIVDMGLGETSERSLAARVMRALATMRETYGNNPSALFDS